VTRVVSITGNPVANNAEPNQAFIDMLEEVLANAKSGRHVSGAIAMVNSDGSIQQEWRGGGHSLLLVASISVLNHDFIAAVK